MLSDQLLDVLDQLQRAVVCIQSDWELFKRLYLAPQPGQIDAWPLLMDADELFFLGHREMLANYLILSIARITDPAESMSRENCTLERLQKLIEHVPLSCPRLSKRLSIVDKRVKVLRETRNRRIAHTDLETRLAEAARIKTKLNAQKPLAESQVSDSVLTFQGSRHKIDQVMRSVIRYLESAIKLLRVDETFNLRTGIASSDGSVLVDTLVRMNQLEDYYHLKEFGKPRKSRTVDDE